MINAYSYVGGCRSFPRNLRKSRLRQGDFSFGSRGMASRCLMGIFRSSFGQRNCCYSFSFFSAIKEWQYV